MKNPPRLFIFIAFIGVLLLLPVWSIFLKPSSAEEAVTCAAYLETEGQKELDAYKTFMDEYFQFVEPASGQVENAIQRFLYYRDAIDALYQTALDIPNGKPFKEALKEKELCENVKQQFLDYGDALLEAYSRGASASKSTFVFVDALKLINERVSDELVYEFHFVFPSIFTKFDHLFVCYAKQCIQKPE